MIASFDFSEVKKKYQFYYNEAIRNKEYKLPFYEIQQWDKVLGPIELRMFEDIRYIGLELYPILPISEDQFLHFGNPFKKIGIEIDYTTSSKSIIEKKLKKLKEEDWTVYKADSRDTYYTASEFFRFKRKFENLEFEDLDYQTQFKFVERYKDRNSSCLLYYISFLHFNQ